MTGQAELFGFDPPELPPDAAAAIATAHWAVAGAPQRLRGERSANTRISHPDGRAWTLQVQSASEHPEVIDLQTRAMQHLERSAPDVPVPRVVPTVAGAVHAEVDLAGQIHLARLVTFLPGTTFDPMVPMPDAAYRGIGGALGRMAAGLADFDHPAAAHFMPWDIANGLAVDPAMRGELGRSSAAALELVDDRLHAAVAAMGALPRRTIHNDGHAYNLLRPDTESHQVSGVIDFGDLVRTVRAADVAIIAESFAPDHPDPAAVVAAATAGYHAEHPLDDDELAAIPELVLVRTALNVLLVEHQIRHAPHLAGGAAESLPGVVERLLRWNRLDAGAMVARIRAATGTPTSTGPGAAP
jgi:Ser/Thr protein kinase RdoA (MazF antagonist)